MIIHEIHMDLVNRGTPCRIDAVQGEQGSRSIRAYLYAAGQPWVVPDDVVVSLRYRKPNNKSGSYSNREDGSAAWTADGNSLTISIEKQALNVSGVVMADIVLSKANYILATFPILIYASPSPSGEADSSDDSAGGDGGSSDGLSDKEKEIILTLFKNIAYTSDMSAKVAELETMWSGSGGDSGGGDTGGGDTPPDDTTDPIEKYTVTNNLTNVTNSNTQTEVSSTDGYYSATLSAEDGYVISVTITMGGVDITDSVYTEDGTILIPEVTGDIVITATAELATAPVLYQLANTPRTVNADLFEDTGLTFGSDTANGYTKAWTMVAKVKNMTAGTLWCVNGNTGLRSYYENRWNGEVANNAVHLTTSICATVTRPSITQENPDVIAIVITKAAMSKKTATVHHLNYAGELKTDELVGTYGTFNTETYAGNMFVGGSTKANFVGTIEEFTIYEGVATEDQIKSYLGVS